jgi:hypothetical protein
VSESDAGGSASFLPSLFSAILQALHFCLKFFAFLGAKLADILKAPCLLSSAAKVLSFLAFVCGKEEDPRGGGLDSLWRTNNKPFFDDEASVAF